ncbi:hypothetical protein F4560_006380 [Saccharothrix ecbatanensis]|uniref:TIR domain-containing protein n=1 Tax=Saccharothrix ecbatanensis TaxID=1105145 RepID=A0A7W9HQF9_9PSEU|nr:toll/interleukin-1 receptor domain-containing protein [Saccharothrix ecbatanensis]MBB5806612.1 hypothetical protein [Saccharothrix ecbatanensis]
MHEAGAALRRRTKYDLFISYNTEDRPLVRELAEDLHRFGVRVWWDAWEMKPGDFIRDRINDGITSAGYFLAVLSPSALRSNWVKYELTSGMLLEIERAGVRVVPALVAGLSVGSLPVDLRAKKCLLLDPDNYRASVEELVDLVKPERRQRAELLNRLRDPKDVFRSAAVLRPYALHQHDQTVEKAALEGLRKIGGPEAVVVVTERALNTWGVSAIERALKTLMRMRADSGLLAFCTTLLRDSRYLIEKINTIAETSPEVSEALADFDGVTDWEIAERLGKVLNVFYTSPNPEIRYGTALSRALLPPTRLAGKVDPPPEDLTAEAVKFADQALPNLTAVLRNCDRYGM